MSISADSEEERNALKDQILEDIGRKLVTDLQKELSREEKVVSGLMLDSLNWFPEDKIVGSKREGMDNLEYGRFAGSHVPLKPLMEWAKKKFGISEGEAWGVAKKVENHIFEEGIPMTRFAKITLEKVNYG